jgi:hypothetical protein
MILNISGKYIIFLWTTQQNSRRIEAAEVWFM